MSKQLIRIYKKFNPAEIKENMLIYGDTSGSCANCQKMDLELGTKICPACKTEFKYISFRNVRSHLPKINKLYEQAPSMTIVDYEDYSRHLGANKARDLFK